MPDDAAHDDPPAGLTLRQLLRGHRREIFRIAWSPEGEQLASASADGTVRVWDVATGEVRHTFEGRTDWVQSIVWSPDGRTLAATAPDDRIRLWDVGAGRTFRALRGHTKLVQSLAWSGDGRTIASASRDNTIRLWDAATTRLHGSLAWHADTIYSLAWAPDGRTLAGGAIDATVRLLDVTTGKLLHTLQGHTHLVSSVAWAPDGRTIASGSSDQTVRFWDPETGRQIGILEGHTGPVTSISFSGDGRLLASKSLDGTVRLWRCDTWETVAVLDEPTSSHAFSSIAFHPTEPVLATLGERDRVMRVWALDLGVLLGVEPAVAEDLSLTGASGDGARSDRTVHYTNAKVVLVGDTGVGKSGLGLVLTGQPFQPTESTHGRNVWTFDIHEVALDGGRKETRETLLWDLAGQPGYRLIHQLHLNEVAVALVVVDARSETDPFAGVRHWDRALRQAQRAQGESVPPMKKFLVAARMDRGGLGVSRARIDSLVRDLGFDGHFETSAREGWHVAELAEAISGAIAWDALPKVSSTALFQRIKAFLVEEKETGRLLSTADDLYRAFLRTPDAAPDGDKQRAQFETCIGRVESRGLIRRLSFGSLVLLQPELLDAYASAIVNAAKDEPDGLGSIAEDDAVAGRFRMPPAERISDKAQERLLLIATVEELLRHEIALREQAIDGPELVFPSQLTRENPALPDPQARDVIFTFEGPLLNIYATLAVRLSRSGLFAKKEMWKNAATYTARVGGTCGMFLRATDEGRGELALFFDTAASEATRFQFEEYVSVHLQRRALPETIQRRRIFVCPACDTPVTDMQARRRRERGFDWIRCSVCDTPVSLLDREERLIAPPRSAVPEMDRMADALREREAGAFSAVAEMRTRGFREWAGSSKTILALVMTDIVDSTALTNELGNEAWSQVLHAHFEQARRLIKHHEGYEIKTVGDALMVAFRTAVTALDFALALHAGTGHEQVRIRAGIHVGPVEIQDEDVYGAMVNYTTRVENQATGAEIWVSDRAKADIDEERAEARHELRWVAHPDRELKGFAGKHLLWSVLVPEQQLAAARR